MPIICNNRIYSHVITAALASYGIYHRALRCADSIKISKQNIEHHSIKCDQLKTRSVFRLTYLISLVVQNYGLINRICIAVSKSTPKSCSTAERGSLRGGSKVGNWEKFVLSEGLRNHCVKSGKKQTTNVILVCQFRTKV